jgi:hypothetical protein
MKPNFWKLSQGANMPDRDARAMDESPRARKLSRRDVDELRVLFKRVGNLGRTSAGIKAQRRAVERAGNTCAVCRQAPPAIRSCNGAHITPHEEGGPEDTGNIISLCIRRKRSLKSCASATEIGCHDLFDNYQVWTRKEMSDLQCAVGSAQFSLLADAALGKRAKWEGKLHDDLDRELANRRWGHARRIVARKLKLMSQSAGNIHRTSDVAVNAEVDLLRRLLVAVRKGAGIARWEEIPGIVRMVRELLCDNRVGARQRAAALYEFGMLCFQTRAFSQAAQLFHRSARKGDPKSAINLAAGEIARFESLRRGGAKRPRLRAVVARLLCCRDAIDRLHKAHATTKEDSSALNPWRVDSRIHAARMLAVLGDCKAATHLLKAAKKVRDSAIVEPSVFSNLAIAEAEVAFARKDYGVALTHFCRAGFKLVTTEHKDFEALETVLQRLIETPPATMAALAPALRRALRKHRRKFAAHLEWLGQMGSRELLPLVIEPWSAAEAQ